MDIFMHIHQMQDKSNKSTGQTLTYDWVHSSGNHEINDKSKTLL